MLYVAVLCSAGLVLPGLWGYTATGRSVFLFCTGLSLCYLAALVLAAAEVALTGGAGLRGAAAFAFCCMPSGRPFRRRARSTRTFGWGWAFCSTQA